VVVVRRRQMGSQERCHQKHERRLTAVFVAVMDVGKEGVDRVKGLAPARLKQAP
jgi:hypothetical protein